MDRKPEELQHLGFAGICREAFTIVLSLREIFSKIILSLIFPLCIIFLAHIEITHVIFHKIDRNAEAFMEAPEGSAAESKFLSRLASEWATYLLFKGGYLLAVLIFSLLSTSAVVYTVACQYTAKEITFPKVMNVLPKVWKRLMVTFLWSFGIILCYNIATILIIIFFILLFGGGIAGLIMVIVISLIYLVGLIYISIVWHLASVVSVLEDSYGLSAMEKSKDLIRGKIWVAVAIFLVVQLVFMGIELLFKSTVVQGRNNGLHGILERVGFGALIMPLLSILILLGLVMQAVVYFVCKSYHHQSIDKSKLADHLEIYHGEYLLLKDRDLQLHEFHV